MALIKCPECGKEISDKAISCPSCGCPVNEQKPIVIKKDYKAKAKVFIIVGITVFLVTCIAGVASTSKMVALKAQYVMGNGGAYPIYNFIMNLFIWIGIGLFAIGIIYWIINTTKNKK